MIMNDLNSLCLLDLTRQAWKISNRSGGYSSSTVALMNTSRAHGLLVAPMTRGAQRMVLLSRRAECLRSAGRQIELGCNESPGVTAPRGDQFLRGFGEVPSPGWRYSGEGWTLEKKIYLLEDRNTVIVSYRLAESQVALELTVRPLFALRPQRELMYQWNGHLSPEKRTRQDFRIPATHRTPEVFFSSDGLFDPKGCWYFNTIYRGGMEGEGEGMEDLWCPGLIQWTLEPGVAANFVCSTEPVTTPMALDSLRRADRQPRLDFAGAKRAGAEAGFGKSSPDSPDSRQNHVKFGQKIDG